MNTNTYRSVCFTLAVGALCLAGCATVSPARGNYALIPIIKVNSSSIHVESAYLAEIASQLTVIGRVRKLHWNSVGSIHVDVTFLGVQGKQIATKTATIRFSHSRIGAPPAAQFYLPVEIWPEGTTKIVVRPHFDQHHNHSAEPLIAATTWRIESDEPAGFRGVYRRIVAAPP